MLAIVVPGLCQCNAVLMRPGRVTEHRSTRVVPSHLRTIAVIAGDDSRPALRMSAMVRQDLVNAGWNAVRRSGRWATENEAVEEICRSDEQETPVDGVLIVFYDQLTLRDCETKAVAYQIESGGRIGLPEMTQRLIQYLGSGGKPPVTGRVPPDTGFGGDPR